MAEGWASRFLVRLFADRTVLFVGYSVTDPLMRYVLQALPPTDRWYALWHEDEVTPDAPAKITPVIFRSRGPSDRFGDLNEGIRHWHWYAAAKPSDHEQAVRRLIEAGPPASPRDADYLRARLGTNAGRHLFWTCATDVAWFEWATSEGILDVLGEVPSGDAHAREWARWCVTYFAGGDSPPLLRFLSVRPPAPSSPLAARRLVFALEVLLDREASCPKARHSGAAAPGARQPRGLLQPGHGGRLGSVKRAGHQGKASRRTAPCYTRAPQYGRWTSAATRHSCSSTSPAPRRSRARGRRC
jgi:hypothetical protein